MFVLKFRKCRKKWGGLCLSGRDPDHYRIVLLEWATALEMLLAAEGGKKGEAAALRLQERIESARSAILG